MFRMYTRSHYELGKNKPCSISISYLTQILWGSSCLGVLLQSLVPKVLCCRLRRTDCIWDQELIWISKLHFHEELEDISLGFFVSVSTKKKKKNPKHFLPMNEDTCSWSLAMPFTSMWAFTSHFSVVISMSWAALPTFASKNWARKDIFWLQFQWRAIAKPLTDWVSVLSLFRKGMKAKSGLAFVLSNGSHYPNILVSLTTPLPASEDLQTNLPDCFWTFFAISFHICKSYTFISP